MKHLTTSLAFNCIASTWMGLNALNSPLHPPMTEWHQRWRLGWQWDGMPYQHFVGRLENISPLHYCKTSYCLDHNACMVIWKLVQQCYLESIIFNSECIRKPSVGWALFRPAGAHGAPTDSLARSGGEDAGTGKGTKRKGGKKEKGKGGK